MDMKPWCTIRRRCSQECCVPPRRWDAGVFSIRCGISTSGTTRCLKLKEGQVSVALPAVFTKYVSGVPDLHVPGYEYQPYRDTADFHYDVHNGFYQTRVGNDSDLIHFYKSSGPNSKMP